MANLSIRNLDPHLRQQPGVPATLHDRSMEAEVHKLLRQALDNPTFSSVSSTAPNRQPTESPVGTTITEVHPA